MKTSAKLIYFHPFAPIYGVYEKNGCQPAPDKTWETANGSWVGIWGKEWADLLGGSVLNVSENLKFEVWQPDPRADKVYSHFYDNGLVHRNFPATIRKGVSGDIIFSKEVIRRVKEEAIAHNVILQTGVSPGLGWLLKEIPNVKVLGTYHGTINLPHLEFFRIRKNPWRYIQLGKEFFQLKSVLPYYDLIVYQNETNINELSKLFSGKTVKITMGTDFDRFRPISKEDCRKALGLPLDKKILLTVGRLSPVKQYERILKALADHCADEEYLLIIIGKSEDTKYLSHLKQKAASQIKSGKVLFPGFKSGEELVKYYNASDLYLMCSNSEGGPVTSMEAIACETPVFSTNTGFVAELLNHYNRGCISGITTYDRWGVHFKAFINNELSVLPLERDIAKREFSWPVVGFKFYQAYLSLFAKNQPYSVNPSYA